MDKKILSKIGNSLQWLMLITIFIFHCSLFAENPPKKLALVFLTRKGLVYGSFWKSILQKHADKFNFYIYSDTPLSDPIFEAARIKQLIPTSWDYHIKTWQLLLAEAFKNPENYKFVYLSESCMPIMALEDIYAALTDDDISYMCYADPWWGRNDCREVVELPIEHRWGNHEWVILNRRHAEMIIKDRHVINIVAKYWIDSESYPSTLFSVKGCLEDFCRRPTTYVNWSMPEGGGAHPYHFRVNSVFNYELLLQAKKEKHFFARKIVPPFPAETIWQIINHSN